MERNLQGQGDLLQIAIQAACFDVQPYKSIM